MTRKILRNPATSGTKQSWGERTEPGKKDVQPESYKMGFGLISEESCHFIYIWLGESSTWTCLGPPAWTTPETNQFLPINKIPDKSYQKANKMLLWGMCSCQETPPKYNESQIRNTLLVFLWTQHLEFPQAVQTQQISVRMWGCQQQMRHTLLHVLAWLLMLQIGKRTCWEVRPDWLIKPSVQFLHSKRRELGWTISQNTFSSST